MVVPSGNIGGIGIGGDTTEHVIRLQYKFEVARVIWLTVTIFFVKPFFLLCSKNE
ncbi:unnamed protein product [Acanthoscelides obtectus]|uniref:Uncharacterized protein n=1 Tax=Acanthoscelides obtectus TaxID=200917 RepID=A0A9P0LV36_ACAOB|nr:unnamed protein product [Acanthoscelides obtectus]CAK1667829.1 hypothetical protein AOBTE_LOCUS26052 [Acanthoscelides obtectus]